MPTDDILRNAHWLLRFDDTVQYLGVALSVIGVGCTIYGVVEFMRQMHALNGVQRMVAWSHVVGQAAVLVCQLILLVINVLVLTLPDIPAAMYLVGTDGAWTVFVIMTRKLLRLLIIVVLAISSVHRVWTFQRLLAYMQAQAVHHHRRSTDPPLPVDTAH